MIAPNLAALILILLTPTLRALPPRSPATTLEAAFPETGVLNQDQVPNEGDVRRKIESRINVVVKGGRLLNPGLAQECISDTLAFGVPAYNSGDREGCARFYVKTAEALCSAFPAEKNATPPGWRCLSDLKAALKRAATSKDADDRAWAVRFAFDKILIVCETQAAQLRALIGLGNQNFGAGRYAEAAEAYQEAAALLNEVVGEDLSRVDPAVRVAPLMSGHALLAQGKFKDAFSAISTGLTFAPDFPKGKFDFRTLFRADRYEKIVEGLKAAAEEDQKSADLAFLLGYVYFHSGKRAEAEKEFERAQEIAPEHSATKVYRGERSADPKKKVKDF